MSREVLEKIIQLITAASGLVAALAWNDAVQSLFTLLFGTAGDLAAKFTYAVLVTVVVVFVTIRLGRVAERYGKPDEGEEAGK